MLQLLATYSTLNVHNSVQTKVNQRNGKRETRGWGTPKWSAYVPNFNVPTYDYFFPPPSHVARELGPAACVEHLVKVWRNVM